ncbi:unnamed protein product [Vitrella brassicaformis CCMP3155]|uniref:Uncharacterized protein n=1 Tax=Vitrella brassicaformis (strain CCMP3155) TaxID=1169540 RepID=A0A0G4F9B7_VITBC|nr:unnamed protein product [Vitrella brassicaformis CCMP3155]|eukprot:CEM08964.1 unnamed protein product [Vitrella brassicaformis CCMP3155]
MCCHALLPLTTVLLCTQTALPASVTSSRSSSFLQPLVPHAWYAQAPPPPVIAHVASADPSAPASGVPRILSVSTLPESFPGREVQEAARPDAPEVSERRTQRVINSLNRYGTYCGPTKELSVATQCRPRRDDAIPVDGVDRTCMQHDVNYCTCELYLQNKKKRAAPASITIAGRYLLPPFLFDMKGVDEQYFRCIHNADEILYKSLESRLSDSSGLPSWWGYWTRLKFRIAMGLFKNDLDNDLARAPFLSTPSALQNTNKPVLASSGSGSSKGGDASSSSPDMEDIRRLLRGYQRKALRQELIREQMRLSRYPLSPVYAAKPATRSKKPQQSATPPGSPYTPPSMVTATLAATRPPPPAPYVSPALARASGMPIELERSQLRALIRSRDGSDSAGRQRGGACPTRDVRPPPGVSEAYASDGQGRDGEGCM